MKFEGKMIGPWVAECRRVWSALQPSLCGRKLALDLCGVTFVDESGLELLREIYRAAHPEMTTSSPLTRHFVDQATRSTTNRKEGD